MHSSSSQALLLVDGYNIIGAWSSLKENRDRHGLESAREALIESLINYAAMAAYKTKVVFDAHYQNTPSCQEEYTSLVSVYYTAFAETADSYIEKFCAGFSNNKHKYDSSRLIVATSDRAQQLTVVGYGAEWLSAQRLQVDIELAIRKMRQKKRSHKKSSGRFLFNSLDPIAQKRLQQWRLGKF